MLNQSGLKIAFFILFTLSNGTNTFALDVTKTYLKL